MMMMMLMKVHWANTEDGNDVVVPPVKQRSENFANELLLPVPWAARTSVSKLDVPRLDRQKAVHARSTEHMVIMEAEPADEQSKDHKDQVAVRTQTVDRIVTEGLLNDQVEPEVLLSSRPGITDGNCSPS